MSLEEKERKTKEVELTKKGEEFTVRKGAYHRATGIPEEETIPISRINADIKKGGKIGRMARSAKGFKAMHPKGEGNGNGNGYHPTVAEKEHPKGPLGTVKGHKTTKKQQALFGIARGMQKGETPKGYSPQAAKLSRGLSGKEVHKIASKPKGGFRRSRKSEATALERVMQMVREEEIRYPFEESLGLEEQLPNMGQQATPINQAAQPTATAAGGAPGAPPAISNQIKISGPGGANFIVGYVNASKAWAIYKQEGGAGKATLMPGPPLRSLAAAFTQVAQYF
jgi:hypothetical protein